MHSKQHKLFMKSSIQDVHSFTIINSLFVHPFWLQKTYISIGGFDVQVLAPQDVIREFSKRFKFLLDFVHARLLTPPNKEITSSTFKVLYNKSPVFKINQIRIYENNSFETEGEGGVL